MNNGLTSLFLNTTAVKTGITTTSIQNPFAVMGQGLFTSVNNQNSRAVTGLNTNTGITPELTSTEAPQDAEGNEKAFTEIFNERLGELQAQELVAVPMYIAVPLPPAVVSQKELICTADTPVMTNYGNESKISLSTTWFVTGPSLPPIKPNPVDKLESTLSMKPASESLPDPQGNDQMNTILPMMAYMAVVAPPELPTISLSSTAPISIDKPVSVSSAETVTLAIIKPQNDDASRIAVPIYTQEQLPADNFSAPQTIVATATSGKVRDTLIPTPDNNKPLNLQVEQPSLHERETPVFVAGVQVKFAPFNTQSEINFVNEAVMSSDPEPALQPGAVSIRLINFQGHHRIDGFPAPAIPDIGQEQSATASFLQHSAPTSTNGQEILGVPTNQDRLVQIEQAPGSQRIIPDSTIRTFVADNKRETVTHTRPYPERFGRIEQEALLTTANQLQEPVIITSESQHGSTALVSSSDQEMLTHATDFYNVSTKVEQSLRPSLAADLVAGTGVRRNLPDLRATAPEKNIVDKPTLPVSTGNQEPLPSLDNPFYQGYSQTKHLFIEAMLTAPTVVKTQQEQAEPKEVRQSSVTLATVMPVAEKLQQERTMIATLPPVSVAVSVDEQKINTTVIGQDKPVEVQALLSQPVSSVMVSTTETKSESLSTAPLTSYTNMQNLPGKPKSVFSAESSPLRQVEPPDKPLTDAILATVDPVAVKPQQERIMAASLSRFSVSVPRYKQEMTAMAINLNKSVIVNRTTAPQQALTNQALSPAYDKSDKDPELLPGHLPEPLLRNVRQVSPAIASWNDSASENAIPIAASSPVMSLSAGEMEISRGEGIVTARHILPLQANTEKEAGTDLPGSLPVAKPSATPLAVDHPGRPLPSDTGLANFPNSQYSGVVPSIPTITTNDIQTYTNSSVFNSRVDIPITQNGWEQVWNQRIVSLAETDLRSAVIHINPPELGPVSVHLLIADDQAKIHFSSQHVTVREALESTLPRLKEMLADTGIQLLKADISTTGFTGYSHDDRQAPQRYHPTDYIPASETSSEPLPEAVNPKSRQRQDSVIDAFV